jgi:hypothetical protein
MAMNHEQRTWVVRALSDEALDIAAVLNGLEVEQMLDRDVTSTMGFAEAIELRDIITLERLLRRQRRRIMKEVAC